MIVGYYVGSGCWSCFAIPLMSNNRHFLINNMIGGDCVVSGCWGFLLSASQCQQSKETSFHISLQPRSMMSCAALHVMSCALFSIWCDVFRSHQLTCHPNQYFHEHHFHHSMMSHSFMHVCMCLYVCMYLYVCVCIYMYACVCVCMYLYVFVCIFMYEWMCLWWQSQASLDQCFRSC